MRDRAPLLNTPEKSVPTGGSSKCELLDGRESGLAGWRAVCGVMPREVTGMLGGPWILQAS